MKRITTAAVAAATALSLVAMPAQAAEKKSSEVSDPYAIGYIWGCILKDSANKGAAVSYTHLTLPTKLL